MHISEGVDEFGMTHTCRNCKRTFGSELELELHRDGCSDAQLFCEVCGDRFAERTATTDGWRFACPNEDCEGEGLEADLHSVGDVLVSAR
ncbi:transcription regulator/DNA-binding protein [Halococcus hamelinensis 100A6]|uniref:Transcription regulator/DNA-binding protein n=2 Tax=Halococcus hamelinensis TaxID=332168 RepID=M0LZD1_9EURY|nr:transcription regulator/DNA-binding protein [Halococcus hamelinensis 100A6]